LERGEIHKHQNELMRIIKLKDDKMRTITSELNI